MTFARVACALCVLLCTPVFADGAVGRRAGGSELAPERATRLEGTVLDERGVPAEGALVVTSAGGSAVTDRGGRYRLDVRVPAGATTLRVTAVGSGAGNRAASALVALGADRPAALDPLRLAAGAAPSPAWLPTFGGGLGLDGEARAMVVWDDGTGPALYVGGQFFHAGGVSAPAIARWDGRAWSDVGGGTSSMSSAPATVLALVVHDDGSGEALYAGGTFQMAGGLPAPRIARWDGSSWSDVGGGMSGGGAFGATVYALCVYDDGAGPALYASGSFTIAGGEPAPLIAKWDGAAWSDVGGGLTGLDARVMLVHDDGSGPALYVGGPFSSAGGAPIVSLARWDGAQWTGLGASPTVYALQVFDAGDGPQLHVGGSFLDMDGVAVNRVARWDGAQWSPVGDASHNGVNDPVYSLLVHDDGSGPALFVAGDFNASGSQGLGNVARWDGTSWSHVGDTYYGARCMAVFDDGDGPALHVGGQFGTIASAGSPRLGVNYIARYRGAQWAPLGEGLDNEVLALAVYDDGGGPALYATGEFTNAGEDLLERIARWDGSSWSQVGNGLSRTGRALAVWDDGNGPALYVAGDLRTVQGDPGNGVLRWDGTSFAALGGGLTFGVHALTVFDDGNGPALYAGGNFQTADGASANRVARWNGRAWTPLGSGVGPLGVRSLLAWDDGGGEDLYVGGFFHTAGGAPAERIARWDGSSWSSLGSGMDSYVYALAAYDDGSGPALVAGGYFTTAGGQPANLVARWDGAAWSPLGSGFPGAGQVHSLATFDDGSGALLYAGGTFSVGGGSGVDRIARWDGSSWSSLGSGVGGESEGLGLRGVFALAIHDEGAGPALFAGGSFAGIPDSGDSPVGKWGSLDATAPAIQCPAQVVAIEDGGGPGRVVSFSVTAADAVDAAPVVVSIPPSGSVFPRGTTMVTCVATDASGNQATCQFPVTVRSKMALRKDQVPAGD